MKRLTESQIQQAFFDYVRLRQDETKYNPWNMIYSTPNQRTNNNFGQINRFKKEGLANGFPDISILVARKPYHAYFIELKRRGGKASENQIKWIAKLQDENYKADLIVTDDPEDLIKAVRIYLGEIKK